MREHLVGYLLGVLDDAEQVQVRERLDDDPQLRQDLERIRSRLQPLEATKVDVDPPPGLARRTCSHVAVAARRRRPARANPRVAVGTESASRGFTPADAVVAIGVVLAASIFFFPAIANSRFQARVAACQNNLRELHVDLRQYSQNAGQGHFPFVPPEGNRSAAGIYTLLLKDAGLLENPRIVLCPSSPRAERGDDFHLPTLAEIDQAEGWQLLELRSTMGGDYGYCLGYQLADRRLVAVRDRGRDHFVLVTDAPRLTPAGGNSPNHGGHGQNVLYEGGRVKYLRTCREAFSGDDFFVNDLGQVEAGVQPDDSVVGASAVPPIRVLFPPPGLRLPD
jgi:hypothetical protein